MERAPFIYEQDSKYPT